MWIEYIFAALSVLNDKQHYERHRASDGRKCSLPTHREAVGRENGSEYYEQHDDDDCRYRARRQFANPMQDAAHSFLDCRMLHEYSFEGVRPSVLPFTTLNATSFT
jgi:hypothetical protein